jgi:hypothetical protein
MRKINIVCFCMLITIISNAQSKYVNDFLNIGVGARGLSMGGAQAASVKDVTAGYWNPAGLRTLPSDFQFAIMHNEYFAGLAKYDYAGVAYRLANNQGNIGVNIIRFGVDDIPNTIGLYGPDGIPNYNNIKSFSAVDYAAIISYCREIKPKSWAQREDYKLSIGANLKILNRSIGSFATAWGVGIDAGAKLEYKRWLLGVVLKDATTTYTGWSFSLTDREKAVFESTKNIIPTQSNEVMTPRVILGLGHNMPIGSSSKLLAEVNMDISTDGKRYGNLINAGALSATPRGGLEYGYRGTLFFRAGINGIQSVKDNSDTTYTDTRLLYQPSIGMGVYMSNISIDYALSSLNLQSNPLYSHIISLKFDLRKPKKFRKNNDAKAKK